MNTTNVYEIFFSPTGGTRQVVELLGEAWNKKKEQIDLSRTQWPFTYGFGSDELCIIGVPSFGGRVPAPAAERLQYLKGNNTPVLLTAVYGNRDYEDTLAELEDLVTARGFVVIGAVAAIAEHSILHQFATGRPDEDDQKQLKGFAETIKASMASMTQAEPVKMPGNRPYKPLHVLPMQPQAGNSCGSCGLCATECPVGAIPKDAPATTDKEACISCMRCISVCPQHARKLNPLTLFMAGQKLKKACAVRKENQLFVGDK
ncbi:MAG: 4Fe-4S binding protein [Lachnospiraceae bacterium]